MTAIAADDDLIRRLPLPLAQLYRRAHNAKTSLERHLSAFYFWEAGLKLLGSAAIVDYAALGQSDAGLTEELKDLSRPALGHWWKFARRIVPILADADVAGWPSLRDLLLGRSRDDLPRAAGLDAVLIEVLQDKHVGRSTVRLTELFDRLVQYRNGFLGHAAPGHLKDDFNNRLARALLAGISELWSKLDVLAGRRLVFVPEVRPARGAWLVQRYELAGEAPRRLEALELARQAAAPDQQAVYLTDGSPILTALHPLVLFDLDVVEFQFLNARRNAARVEYLCYTTGRTSERDDLGAERRELLARVVKMPVSPGDELQWAEHSRAESEPEAPATDSGARRTLGGFELLSELGRGGMGVVYRAWQPSLGRQVALKKLLPTADIHRAEDRFRREIRALGRVDHPHLVKVFTSGSDGDDWYFAMELVDGAPLSDVCTTLHADSPDASTVDLPAWQKCVSSACAKARDAEKPFSDHRDAGVSPAGAVPDESVLPSADSGSRLTGSPGKDYVTQIVTLMRQVADATQALHDHGIVHRDIKPGNIQLSRDGADATLMDLGLAQIADEIDGRLTRTRQFVGTLRYASPEQVLSVGRLDGRSDVYSLGATLWELLTLRPLFGATDQTPTPQLMLDIQNREPDRLRKLNPSAGRDLEAVVHKCLEKRPEHRYATARELADDLQRLIHGEPVTARRVKGVVRAARWVRRRPALATLYTAIAALVVLNVGSVIVYQHRLIVHAAGERQARATEMVNALGAADTASLPQIVRGLESVRADAEPLLLEKYNTTTPGSRDRFRCALACLPIDPDRVGELLEYIPSAGAEEVLVLRDALRDHGDRITSLWPRLATADPSARLRLAALLSGYLPADERWQPYVAGLVYHLVRLNPLELAAWAPALEPLHEPLTPAILEAYRAIQARLGSSDLEPQELVAAATQFDLSATLLARYASDQPTVLAELLQTADARHYGGFLAPANAHRDAIAENARAIINRAVGEGAKDEAIHALAARRANAAITLHHFGDPAPAWEMLRHTPDPTARSYLIHGLSSRGVNARVLMQRFEEETEISVRRALLLALGGFDPSKLPAAERERFTAQLLGDFRNHPDAGLHEAIDWLLRQKWGSAASLDRITTELRGTPADKRDWFVNSEDQTFSIIRGPNEFTMGSPPGDPGRVDGIDQMPCRKRIPRSFAIAAREVAATDYLRFRIDFNYDKHFLPDSTGPINAVTWYDAVAYCNWLSQKEGLPETEWCYPKDPKDYKTGMKLPADFLTRTGYRLPTEAEWEYACRAGATTARPYGRGTELLGQYGWFLGKSRNRLWPVGQLKPNDFGLFDMLGNATEWCQDEATPDADLTDERQVLTVSDAQRRFMRGASYINVERELRSACRTWGRPGYRINWVGFRPARTWR
jgi:serine/threonine protein kinase/formylglycine-generating enzyme required for sulfatase activity